MMRMVLSSNTRTSLHMTEMDRGRRILEVRVPRFMFFLSIIYSSCRKQEKKDVTNSVKAELRVQTRLIWFAYHIKWGRGGGGGGGRGIKRG